MASKISFSFNDGELIRNTKILEEKIDGALGVVMDYYTLRGQEILKTGAPWTDRTGAARTGLHTVGFSSPDKHTIVFAHAVHYGIWLEVKFSGRDEAIMPAVRQTGRELMGALNGLMRRM